jgi:hypothetical protein
MSKLGVLTALLMAFAIADLAATTTAAPAQAAPKRGGDARAFARL